MGRELSSPATVGDEASHLQALRHGERHPDRTALVAHAQDAIARGSKSFALASRLFDPATRERVWLLYAWCRACDDIADGQDHGGALTVVPGAGERLATIRAQTARALSGEPTGAPAFDALGLVAHETGLTQAMADDVIGGFALDAADWSPRSEADLLRYCFHVAGAVGVMMAVVMGVAPDEGDTLAQDTLDRACDLGIAFQLGNIARDVAEDGCAGRCYLPDDWLAEADVPPGELLKPHYRHVRAGLVDRLGALAATYESSARVGAAQLPWRSRWAVLSAAGIYGGIMREAMHRGAAAWDARVVTTRKAKLGHVARGLGQVLRRGGDAPKPALSRRELAALARS